MKINKPTGIPIVNPYQKQSAAKLDKTNTTAKKDDVQISDAAKAMLETKAQVDPARQEKVDQLKEQVQNGDYKVSSQRVADKLYDFWFKE